MHIYLFMPWPTPFNTLPLVYTWQCYVKMQPNVLKRNATWLTLGVTLNLLSNALVLNPNPPIIPPFNLEEQCLFFLNQ